jgi:hypothetical protein
MKYATIGAGVSATLIAGSVLAVTSAGVGGGPQLERVCVGHDVDESCQVGPPSGTVNGHRDRIPSTEHNGSVNTDPACRGALVTAPGRTTPRPR